MKKISIHWFRRDLRLTDNTALHHAAADSEQVIPLYILSDWKNQHDWTGPARQEYLCGNLASLSGNLENIGSALIIRCGDPEKILPQVIQESGATAVYTNQDPDPYGKAKEKRLEKVLSGLGVEFHLFKDCVMHGAEEILNGSGDPYRVFTPYSKNWLNQPKAAPLPRVKSLGEASPLKSLKLPTLAHWGLQTAGVRLPDSGERAARERLKSFVTGDRLKHYAEKRDTPAGAHTSQLSADLRFGLISIRELYHRCQTVAKEHPSAANSVQVYIKELAWREFYMAVLHHWPDVLEHEFNADFRKIAWESEEALLKAWQQGRTGFPIVDAGMRQLLATGWMHNRLRMITAMFLTKDLHCHWRLGESFFMQHLIDGEIASNNGGWQWSAGTGADAAPYFRIQNPWLQSKRHDPDGAYIKTWIPELKHVPSAKLHDHPERPLAPDYPMPIVDHATARDITLKMFKQAKS